MPSCSNAVLGPPLKRVSVNPDIDSISADDVNVMPAVEATLEIQISAGAVLIIFDCAEVVHFAN